MRYGIVIEKANGNYSAYVPDLPGCISTGNTVEEAEEQIREAIRFHLEGLKEDNCPSPSPLVSATTSKLENVRVQRIGVSGPVAGAPGFDQNRG